MTDYLYPRVQTGEEPPQLPSAPSLATAVPGFVGVAERGPYGATLVTSWPQYLQTFGGFTANTELTKAVYMYFRQLGERGGFCWISRVCHYTDPADASTKTSVAASGNITTTGAATQGEVTSGNQETFELEAGDTLVLKVDGGAGQTATFDAAAAERTGSGGTYPTTFGGGETLLVKIDGGSVQTITFADADETLAQVIQAVNEQISGAFADDNGGELRITSDRKGTGSYVEVTGGTGAATLGMSVGSTQGTGDVSNIAAVTAAEAKTVIENDTTAEVTLEATGEITIKTPTVGDTGSIQVDASSTADGDGGTTKFYLDNDVHAGSAAGAGTMGTATASSDGAWGNGLVIRVAAANNGDSDEFNLAVVLDDVVVEPFYNLSTVVANSNYWLDILNDTSTGSKLVVFTDSLTGVPPNNRPTNGDYTLSSGSDGLSGLVAADYRGDIAGRTGIYAFQTVPDLTLLAVPGAAQAVSAIHNEIVSYCETTRNGQVFPVLDPPAGLTPIEMRTYVRTTASLFDLSEFGAIFYPQVCIPNPAEIVYTSDSDGDITISPSGVIVGIIAKMDRDVEGGVHKAPSGLKRGLMVGVSKFERELDEADRAVIFPSNINPLFSDDGAPPHVGGPVCLKRTGDFGTIGQRRGMSYIERLCRLTVRYNLTDSNTPELRDDITRVVKSILRSEMNVGAFASKVEANAFQVDFGDALNTADVVKAFKLVGRVGVAKARPALFIDIWFSEDLTLAA